MTNVNDRFKIFQKIGSGAYGAVMKAFDHVLMRPVALKAIKMANEKNGFPENAIREIRFLRQLRHETIIGLLDIFVDMSEKVVFLVFEYADFDLTGLMTSNFPTLPQIKHFIRQLSIALYVCHCSHVFHLDIKPANILVLADNSVKLADFGLARVFNPKDNGKFKFDPQTVITLYYRPPELILGTDRMLNTVDIWSLGCSIFEMITYRFLFKASHIGDDIELQRLEQMRAIFNVRGIPDEKEWPNWQSTGQQSHRNKVDLKELLLIKKRPNSFRDFLLDELRLPIDARLRQIYEGSEKEYHNVLQNEINLATDLLMKMLEWDPKNRIGARDIFFHEFVRPPKGKRDFSFLQNILLPEKHVLDYEMERKKEK